MVKIEIKNKLQGNKKNSDWKVKLKGSITNKRKNRSKE